MYSIDSRIHQYGKVMDEWQILKKLGTGSSGETAVFLVAHTEMPSIKSALKIVKILEDTGNYENLSRQQKEDFEEYLRERKQKASEEVLLLNEFSGHPNIVGYQGHKFHKWYMEDGFGCDLLIRMELLSDLRKAMMEKEKQGLSFDEKTVAKIGMDICRALMACHKKHIFHRDIKPENIFFNEFGTYKLGDFGISKILSTETLRAQQTLAYSPAYASPEQYFGEGTEQADIYSLGLVLYELCNNYHLPFAQTRYDVNEATRIRVEGGEPLPRPVNASPALAEIILKACAYEQKDRYPSAEAFYDALQKLAGGTPPPPPPPPIPPTPPTPSTPPTPPTPPKTISKWLIPAIIGITLLVLLLIGYKTVHFWEPATCTQDAFCTLCGKTGETRLGHDWLDATCTQKATCSRCNVQKGSPLGHNWVEATCYNPMTCAACGETSGVPLEHVCTEPDCVNPPVCMACGHTFGEALGHTLTEPTFQDAPVCLVCGETVGEKINYRDLDLTKEFTHVKDLYNEILANQQAGVYRKEILRKGVTAYYDENGVLKKLSITRGTEGIGSYSDLYGRSYYIEDGKPAFAFYQGDDAHRLYFYKGLLMRWRYNPIGSETSGAINHDFTFTDTFMMLERLAQQECALYS